MYRYDSRHPMEFRSDAGAESSVKSWPSNDEVISRNLVARASGARDMVRQTPLFQKLGPDFSTCKRASSETISYLVDRAHPHKTLLCIPLMQARYVTGILDAQ
jgi:hypothetical protein